MSLVVANVRLDRDEWLEKIRQGVWRLGKAPPEIRADREIVLAAVNRFGSDIFHASFKLRLDREIVLIAIKQEGALLRRVSPKFRADPEIAMAAIKQDRLAGKFADYNLRKDPNFIIEAIRQNPGIIEFLDEVIPRGCWDHKVHNTVEEYDADEAYRLRAVERKREADEKAERDAQIKVVISRGTYKGEELSAMGSGRRIAGP